mmetsp:Transcript_19167/g.35758  ORF Transcript_19167/g.35758 Transcript_19167/m.35758 type:complete len:210 (+) Transcript_19167:408-1037(+)
MGEECGGRTESWHRQVRKSAPQVDAQVGANDAGFASEPRRGRQRRRRIGRRHVGVPPKHSGALSQQGGEGSLAVPAGGKEPQRVRRLAVVVEAQAPRALLGVGELHVQVKQGDGGPDGEHRRYRRRKRSFKSEETSAVLSSRLVLSPLHVVASVQPGHDILAENAKGSQVADESLLGVASRNRRRRGIWFRRHGNELREGRPPGPVEPH